MAKIERYVDVDLDLLLQKIDDGILSGISATLEDTSSIELAHGKKAVFKVYERYSAFGGNRVSLSIFATDAAANGKVFLSAIAAGGSEAMFFKINTFGEEAFLDKLVEIIDDFDFKA